MATLRLFEVEGRAVVLFPDASPPTALVWHSRSRTWGLAPGLIVKAQWEGAPLTIASFAKEFPDVPIPTDPAEGIPSRAARS